jgi:nucleoid DNA-binding protein
MSITKRDLVLKITKAARFPQKEVTEIIQMTLDGIADEMAAGNTVELRNFGVFEVVVRQARKGRNPNKPADEVIIPKQCVAKFRAGKELKTRIEALKPENRKK